jgi:hypothetical protein
LGRWQISTAGERPLPRGLARRVDVKDQVAVPLSIEDAANRFRGPPLYEAVLLKKGAEGF